MILTSEQIHSILQKTWPDLQNIWVTDPLYCVMPYKQLVKAINKCSVTHLDYTTNYWDCDDFSLQLQARVQKYQYNLIKDGKLDTKCSYTFGETYGIQTYKNSDDEVAHAINICITDKRVLLIEPQSNEIWKVDQYFHPFFVKF